MDQEEDSPGNTETAPVTILISAMTLPENLPTPGPDESINRFVRRCWKSADLEFSDEKIRKQWCRMRWADANG